jgi:hypothetical protein
MNKKVGNNVKNIFKIALISMVIGILTVILPIFFFIAGIAFIILMLMMWW